MSPGAICARCARSAAPLAPARPRRGSAGSLPRAGVTLTQRKRRWVPGRAVASDAERRALDARAEADAGRRSQSPLRAAAGRS